VKLQCVMCDGLGYSLGILVPATLAVPCCCDAGRRLRELDIQWPATESAVRRAVRSGRKAARVPSVDFVEARRGAARLLVRCSCGVWFDWRAARFVGVQQDAEERLELRTHQACGSTRAIVVWRASQAA